MEHVAGLPITEHCDRRRLPIEERLRLFAAACRAVSHAHRNLVIHRDLKPTNVLVTEDGEVKLLDFGIARLLGDEAGGATKTVGAASELMTPEYASPEQVAGEAVTTASDVYQLGVLLYEVLSGHRPYAGARTSAEIRRAVLEATPERPSTAIRRTTTIVHRDGAKETIEPGVVSDRRGTNPERLRRRLSGDLDTIAMAALRKEPDRRYPSAEALAEDVERHLANLPIRLGGDRLSYRAAKFARRHRFGVVTGAGVLSLTIGLLAFDMARVRSERDRARREEAKASESAMLLHRFFQGWSPDAADRGQVSAEKVLGDAARRAALELRDDPGMLAATLSVLGDLNSALGQTAAADSLLGRALAIQEQPGSASGADLAATLARRGWLLVQMGRYDEGEAALRRALAMHRSNFGPERPETLTVQHELALALLSQWSEVELPEAEALLRDALHRSSDRDTPLATEIASALGYTLFLEARYDEAAAILRPTLERQLRIFGRVHASTLQTMGSLASSLRDPDEMEEADALNREAFEITRALYGDDHVQTGGRAQGYAVFLERKGDLGEAERYARMALAQAERTWGDASVDTALRLRTLGGLRLVRGDAAEAERLLRRALAGLRRAAPRGLPDEGDILNRLAWVLVSRGAPDGVDVYREAVAFERARPAGGPFFITDGYEYLAAAAQLQSDLALAEALYRRALGLYRAQLPDGHPYRAQTAVGLGQTLLDAGRPAEAARYLREGLAQWRARRPPEPERVAEARALLEQSLSGR